MSILQKIETSNSILLKDTDCVDVTQSYCVVSNYTPKCAQPRCDFHLNRQLETATVTRSTLCSDYNVAGLTSTYVILRFDNINVL